LLILSVDPAEGRSDRAREATECRAESAAVISLPVLQLFKLVASRLTVFPVLVHLLGLPRLFLILQDHIWNKSPQTLQQPRQGACGAQVTGRALSEQNP
jgi:hypothetical protein